MSKAIRIMAVIMGLCVLCGFSIIDNKRYKENDIVKYIDTEVVRLVQDKTVKGAVVSVVRDNKVLLCKGYGYTDEEAGTKADGEKTAFRIGSLTKTFVAISALQLAQQGKLDMAAPVDRYLEPDFPRFRYPVTMKDLLTHTAGFENTASGMVAYDRSKVKPLGETVRYNRPNQVFMPGEVQAYSNYGIALAGYVMERITQKPYFAYAEEAIFKPLGMSRTTFRPDFSPVAPVSKGYGTDGAERADYITNIYPSGSVASTASDMAKYMDFLLGEGYGILDSEAKSQLFRRHFAMDEVLPGIGYVWNRHTRNGSLFFEKKGETRNFFSRIILYPDKNIGVFLSFNTVTPEKIKADLMNGITDMLLGSEGNPPAYEGKDNRDISGYYVSTVSSFKTAEKFLNFLNRHSTIRITGKAGEGFYLDGQKLTAVGKDHYKSAFGYLKYSEKNGQGYLSGDTFSYVRASWHDHRSWQGLALLFFSSMSATVFAMSARIFIKGIMRKTKSGRRLIAWNTIPGMAVFLVFVVICIQSLFWAETDIKGLIAILKFEALFVLIFAFLGVLSSLYFWYKKQRLHLCLLYSVWSSACIIFVVWLVKVRLLL